MSGSVVPLGSVRRRLPQAGRIRIGIKDETKRGKDKRRAIDTFRFTSGDADLLAAVAGVYGGNVVPWNDPKTGDRFEVITEARKISVILPPDPMTEWYELWTGDKGLQRRCDGDTCTVVQDGGPDGPVYTEVPCICDRRGVFECKYKLRLSVLLPEIESLGTWRLDTSGKNAQQEIPGVVEAVERLQERGFTRAVLRLERRTAPGRRFVVPVLDPGVSLDALEAGVARVGALGSASAPSSPAGELTQGEEEAVPQRRHPHPSEARAGGVPPPPAPSQDDDVVDAEIIEEVDPMVARAWLDSLRGPEKNHALRRARELSAERGLPAPTSAAAIDPEVLNALAAEWEPL